MGERAVEITPELVDQYSDAVDDHNRWYSGESAFGGAVAPALLLHSEVYRTLSWYLPRIYGNLHARQEWDLFQPVMVGDRVTTRSLVIDRYIKRDREYIVNEVTCFGGEGRSPNPGRQRQNFRLEQPLVPQSDRMESEDRANRPLALGVARAVEETSR